MDNYPPDGTYSVTITCPNCAFVEAHDIEKGTAIAEYKRRVRCAKCGCHLSGMSHKKYLCTDVEHVHIDESVLKEPIACWKCGSEDPAALEGSDYCINCIRRERQP